MNSSTFIYIRVSTAIQDGDSQMIGITDYLQKHAIKQFNVFKDTKSGALDWRSRKLANILEDAKAGDKIIVSELSRIGRSTADVLSFLAETAKKQIAVIAVKNEMTFDGSINSKIFSTVLSIAAEIERDFIRQRTKEGMANAAAKGVKIGRPIGRKSISKLQEKQAELEKLAMANVSKTSIAKLLNVSRNTVIRYFKSLEIK